MIENCCDNPAFLKMIGKYKTWWSNNTDATSDVNCDHVVTEIWECQYCLQKTYRISADQPKGEM